MSMNSKITYRLGLLAVGANLIFSTHFLFLQTELGQLFPSVYSHLIKLTCCWWKLHIQHTDMRVVSILSSNPYKKLNQSISQNVKQILICHLWNCEFMVSYRSSFKSTIGSLDCADFTLTHPLGNGLGVLNLKILMQFRKCLVAYLCLYFLT